MNMDFIIAIKRIVEKNEEKQKVLQLIFTIRKEISRIAFNKSMKLFGQELRSRN
jgi:DNA-binding FrmR family transcriptional regulator